MHNDSTLLKAQSPAALAEEYIVKSIWNNYFPPGSDYLPNVNLPIKSVLPEQRCVKYYNA